MAVSLSAVSTPASGASSLSSTILSSAQRLSATRRVVPIRVKALGSTRCGLATEEVADCGVLSAPSLYSLLGLDQHVGVADIKNAYRQMARKYHPDVCPLSQREECTKLFLQVQDAYEILSDPERRAEYDYHLMHPLSANAYGLGNISRNRRSSTTRVAKDEAVSEAWKMQWQAQLSRLQMKSRMEQSQAQAKTSWGAQMRSRSA